MLVAFGAPLGSHSGAVGRPKLSWNRCVCVFFSKKLLSEIIKLVKGGFKNLRETIEINDMQIKKMTTYLNT